MTQTAPKGTQVGYVQDTGNISQTVYLDAGTYQVSFQAAQRAFDQDNYQEIEVLVDGVSYGIIDPASTQYASYRSSTFTVATGCAYHRVPRFESRGRRQYRVPCRGERSPRLTPSTTAASNRRSWTRGNISLHPAIRTGSIRERPA